MKTYEYKTEEKKKNIIEDKRGVRARVWSQ